MVLLPGERTDRRDWRACRAHHGSREVVPWVDLSPFTTTVRARFRIRRRDAKNRTCHRKKLSRDTLGAVRDRGEARNVTGKCAELLTARPARRALSGGGSNDARAPVSTPPTDRERPVRGRQRLARDVLGSRATFVRRSSPAVRRERTARLLAMRRFRPWLRARPLRRMRPRLARGLLLQDQISVSELRRTAHGQRGRAPG